MINAWEHQLGTDPQAIDTDGDQYADSTEISGGTDPADPTQAPTFLHGIPGSRAPTIAEFEAAPTQPPSDVESGSSPLPWLLSFGGLLAVLGAGLAWWRVRPRRRFG